MFRYKQVTKRKQTKIVCRHNGETQCGKTLPIDNKTEQLYNPCERCKEFECKDCKKIKSVIFSGICDNCNKKVCEICNKSLIYQIPHPLCDIKRIKLLKEKIRQKVKDENEKLIKVKDNSVYPNGVIDVIFAFSMYIEKDFESD